MSNNVPNRLKELRERSRLTQKEVGKLLDINFTTVSKHEAGRNLSDDLIEKYAELYKVQSHQLFFEPTEEQEGEDGSE